jgi:glycosyltransferase involved in cell wall biosynthesis
MNHSKIKHISCVIIAKNAQATLANTLAALTEFEDVVLYSNGSTDDTDAIAQQYPNVNLIQGKFIGFGPTKNAAASHAQNSWILSLDADEVVSADFIAGLRQINLNTQCIYSILRENYYQTKQIKHCWGNDIIPRVYNKEHTRFTDKNVHESIIDTGFALEQITGAIKHYPYASVSAFIIKLDHYSTLYAQDNAGIKKTSPIKALLNAKFAFIKTYLLKQGFRDGYPGLIIAFSHMATTFYKHIKLHENNIQLKS